MDRITADELQALVASRSVVLLDVRSTAEYEASHIPGSILVSLDELRAESDTVASLLPDHAVVVCRTGGRAEQACRVLHSSGRDALRVLDGGILAWERAGGHVERGRQRWDLERQVRLVAGGLVVTGVAASLVFRPAVLLAGGVGAGLTFAGTTGTCAMGTLLARLPYNRRATCPHSAVRDRLAHLAERAAPAL